MKHGPQHFDCLIIGAGISGLLAATVLKTSGARCCVLEKSRGVGGRMGTRRQDGAIFDHGAQFITARDERFQVWMDRWLKLGLVQPWYELGDAGTHYRAVPGMTAIAKHLAEGMDICREVRVQQAGYDANQWTLRSDTGQLHTGSALLLTAPVPQSLSILQAGNVEMDARDLVKLKAIRFRRCIAALTILDRPSKLTAHNGALKLPGEPVQWIGDNQRKGVSPSVPAVTIHSTDAFAEAFWDIDDSLRLPKLLEAAAPHLQANVVSCKGHRWGFSEPVTSFDREAFIDRERRLAIAGDGLTGGRIEGAALSGLAAAEGLINSLIAR
jgi:predicted NAD/FAD-dependent oxidoreductase